MRWVKRLLFGAGLLGALLVVGLVVVGWALWSSMQSDEGAEEGPGLTCTSTITVAPATADVPQEALQRVAEAVEDSGRETDILPGYSTGSDVLVHYVEGQPDHRSGGTEPVTLRLGAVPSVEHAADLLGDRLAPCAETPEPVETPAPTVEPEPASDIPWLPWWPWPISSPATWIAVALVATWAVLPVIAVYRHPEAARLLPARAQQALDRRRRRRK